MANQEVVNAINETMVPNGVKAINADSVRNLLLLMAEKMGEGTGSGSGAVRVHMPPFESIDFSQVDFENTDDIEPFTPEEIELIKSMLTKVQQDNKAAYKLLNEHKEQGIADLVMGDQSFFGTIFLIAFFRGFDEVINQINPGMNVDWSSLSFNAVVGIPLFYSNIDADTSGLDENSLLIFEELVMHEGDTPLNEISLFDPSDKYGKYTLMEDGSVMYETEPEPTEYDPLIYVSGNGVELTEDEIEANKKAYDNLPFRSYIGRYWAIKESYLVGDTKYYEEKGGYVHEAFKTISDATSYVLGRFWKGKDMWEVRVYEDGNATLEIYASINPTATE